ncbi:MAG: neprosin family prolyl endopeptidase [Deltaproteobacteria bacterium]|nr:neprosin family prolyl endopeptidase [Deltaproteobacteria bacterium]
MRYSVGVLVLACSVAQAAPPAPDGVVAPKGRPVIPGTALPHAEGLFLYAGYYQDPGTATAGAGAKMKQGDPGLAIGDAHSLGEIAVISADQRQIVEIGWTVDPAVNGDAHPRLFIFHWVDGAPTCYNSCGFVSMSATHKPGMRVTPGEVADYGIALRGTDWWLSYQGVDLGYFPGSLWPTPFTVAGHVQWFGEIAAGTAESCSEMGNGAKGRDPAAASMSGLYLVAPGGARVPAIAMTGTVTNSAYWSVGQTAPDAFAFGGPGAPFGCCTPKTCADSMAACGRVADSCGPQLNCGTCSAQGDICDEVLQCSPAPPPGEQPAADDAGCCSAGSPLRALPSLAVLALVLRRRRRR